MRTRYGILALLFTVTVNIIVCLLKMKYYYLSNTRITTEKERN